MQSWSWKKQLIDWNLEVVRMNNDLHSKVVAALLKMDAIEVIEFLIDKGYMNINLNDDEDLECLAEDLDII